MSWSKKREKEYQSSFYIKNEPSQVHINNEIGIYGHVHVKTIFLLLLVCFLKTAYMINAWEYAN